MSGGRDNRAVGPLILRLRDDEHWVRVQAASALGRIGDNRAAGALILALRDDDAWVRGAVAEALGRIADKQAVCPWDEQEGTLSAGQAGEGQRQV